MLSDLNDLMCIQTCRISGSKFNQILLNEYIKVHMRTITSAFFVVILLSACSPLKKTVGYTKNWNGSDVPGHNYATFDDFNGTQKFNLKLSGSGNFYFKQVTELRTGKLQLTLRSPTRTIFSKDLQGSETDSIQVDNSKNEQFQIILNGDHAAGKVDFKYANLSSTSNP
jgi:hypothetical protein